MGKRTLANKYEATSWEIEPRRENYMRQLDKLKAEGFEVRSLTEWQFRVNNRIDIWPKSGSFHDIKENSRGTIMRTYVQLYNLGHGDSIEETQDLYNFVKSIFTNSPQQAS